MPFEQILELICISYSVDSYEIKAVWFIQQLLRKVTRHLRKVSPSYCTVWRPNGWSGIQRATPSVFLLTQCKNYLHINKHSVIIIAMMQGVVFIIGYGTRYAELSPYTMLFLQKSILKQQYYEVKLKFLDFCTVILISWNSGKYLWCDSLISK